jgi:hypothetical protein
MPKHIADESTLSATINVWLPSFIGLIILAFSVYADLNSSSTNWAQRAGNLIIVIGAYIGYHEVKQSSKYIEGDLYLNPELWYKVLAVIYVVVGTIISGYGDLIVRWL